MALETSGFQLSQFDRAPNIPGNIGLVDTKAIYASVSNALKQNEALRTLQQVQGLNDAQTAYQTAQAQGLLSNLPDTLAADKAKSQLFSASAPYEQSLLQPRFQAERAKLGYETALSGELNKPENISALARSKTLSSGARGVYDLARIAADPNADVQTRNAARIKLRIVQDANQQFKSALDSGKVDFHTTNADGSTYARFRDGSTGIIGYPDTYTGNTATYLKGPISATPGEIVPASTGAPVTTGAPATAGAPASVGATSFAPATGLLSSPAPTMGGGGGPVPIATTKANLLGALREEKVMDSRLRMDEKEYEDLRQTRDVGLVSDSRVLGSLKAKTEAVDAAIDQATQLVKDYSYLITGPGESIRSMFPIPVRATFDALSEEIRANLAFDQLQQMRDNSKTGGALGNVSDVEGKRLESTFGAIKTTQSPNDMVRTLQKIKVERQKLMSRAETEYIAAVARNQAGLARVRPDLVRPTVPGAAPAPQPSPEDLAFGKPSTMIPSQLTFRSPDAPENRFEVSTTPEAPPSSPAGVGGFEYAPEMPSEAALVPATPKSTQSGLRIVSDSNVAPEAAPQDEIDATTEEAPPPPAERDGSLMTAAAGAATAAPLAVKYAPRVAQAFSNPRASALRTVAQLKRGLPGLSGSPMGAARLGGAASAAFGTGYLAGEAINKYGPTITDAFGFTNTKKLSDGKSPMVSDILSDWYMESKQPPAVTLGDRWADAYRAIWGSRKMTDERRAEALASLRETRNNWTSAGYKLSTPVEEFDREQLESAQR